MSKTDVRHPLPPVIILGGEANALSIVRSLGRMGVQVYALNKPTAYVRYSRFTTFLPLAGNAQGRYAWEDFLLTRKSDDLRGAVLLAACDDSLSMLARRHAELSKKYRLDLCAPTAQMQMLDKFSTYRAARAAGVTTPKYWEATTVAEARRYRCKLTFPLLIKSNFTHRFAAQFGKKFLVVHNFDELAQALIQLERLNIEVMLVELIPGGDDLLCSYYTYLDEAGNHLFRFTKRIVRRFPPGMGIACHHITDHIDELVEPATKLFAQAGLRGLANVEFKLDPRDGQLKLIECNARFTAANVLLEKCGYDLAKFVYNRIIGRPVPVFPEYRAGVRLWRPVDDFRALLALRRTGEINSIDWLRSCLAPRKVTAFFDWTDPMPAIYGGWNRVQKRLARKRLTALPTLRSSNLPSNVFAESTK